MNSTTVLPRKSTEMANSQDVVVTGSPPESAGEPQRCLFLRDFACSVLYANRLTPIVCKKSSVMVSCLS